MNGVTLEIPPLRERTDEIPRLVDTFINDFGRDFGRDSGHQPNIAGHARHRRVFIKGFRRESDRQQSFRMMPDAMDILLRYPWPGNIGELKKVIGRALLLCDGSEISPNHLTIEMSATSEGLAGQMGVDAKPEGEDPQHAARSPESDGGRVLPLQSPEAIAERERILEALESAKSLMRSRGTLGYGPLQELESQCSLCGQLERKVRMLISGPRVFICDDCVKESQRIAYAAAESDGPVSLRLKNVLPRYPYVSCAFCGKSSTEVRRLVGGDKALICDECLDLCDHILGERFAGEWPLGIGDAKPLKQLRLTDRRSENRPFASGSDLGLMSPTEAVSRARAAKMLLCFNPRISDVPVFSLREADDEFCEDDPLVMPRKTFTLRPVYPAAAIDAQISQASDQLSHDNPCRIVILVEDGGPDSARRLLDRVKMALRDIAEFREQDAALRRAALTAIALPRPGSDPGA